MNLTLDQRKLLRIASPSSLRCFGLVEVRKYTIELENFKKSIWNTTRTLITNKSTSKPPTQVDTHINIELDMDNQVEERIINITRSNNGNNQQFITESVELYKHGKICCRQVTNAYNPSGCIATSDTNMTRQVYYEYNTDGEIIERIPANLSELVSRQFNSSLIPV